MKFLISFKNVYLFNVVIALIILEAFVYIFLSGIGIKGFSAIPYARMAILLGAFLLLINEFLAIRFPYRFKTRGSLPDIFIGTWFLFTCVELIVGIARGNPPLYIFTDFFYIFFGALLYWVIKNSKKINFNNLEYKFIQRYSLLITVLGIVLYLFQIKFPAVLLIVLLIFSYLHFLNKKYIVMVLTLVPYFLEMQNANRTHFILFFTVILILFLRKIRERFRLIDFTVVFVITVAVIWLFLENILETSFLFIERKSNLGIRIHQLLQALNHGIDYSDPHFISLTQRLMEMKAVVNYWLSNPTSFVFGSGVGGVLDGSGFIDLSVTNASLLGAEKIHNIHLLPFAFIFRYGLLGIVILILLILSVYRSFMIVLNNHNNTLLIFWSLFMVLWVIFSIPASSFLWTTPLFWIACAFVSNAMHRYTN